ncbi:MAG: sigma-54 dependent transcriptional regulator [Acidobacteriota bacterium]
MQDTRPVLLVIDDEPGVVAVVSEFVRRQGFDVIARTGGRQVIAELPALKVDAALVDLRMPEVTGLDVLRAINDADPACQVILMTGQPSVDSAIEAVKLGALDYLSKPFDLTRLREVLTTVRAGLERRHRLFVADSELGSRFEFYGMRGRSPVMQELFDTIRRLAPHLRAALVTGETGTGKELVARALHKLGGRHQRQFLVVNCSAIVDTLFESTLFGHTRGAFTGATEAKAGVFEAAHSGTLFLDEIGELPLAMQVKLLRTIEYGEVQRVGATEARHVDVRLIAATNRDLAEEVRLGRFRQDLYYRLNVVELPLPPLRARREDIPYLAAAFVKEFASRFGKALIGMSAGAERALQGAPWPGNVRELRNTLERACMQAEGRILTEREVVAALGGADRIRLPAPAAVDAQPKPPVPALTRELVEQALQRVNGNISAAARELGISRRALYRRLDTFGLR